MNIDRAREEFEARYPLAPGCIYHEGKYGFWIDWDENGDPEFSTGMGLTQMKWEAWQASRESLVIDLSDLSNCFSPNDCGDWAMWLDDIRIMVQRAGLKVNP